MKPFNLEKALAGEPVVTRDGRKVIEIYCFDFNGKNIATPVVAYIEQADALECFDKNGKWLDYRESDEDLFMAPKKKPTG